MALQTESMRLSCGDRLVTTRPRDAYRVDKGCVEVRPVVFDADKTLPIRELELIKVTTGEFVPAFCHRDGSGQYWQFALIASEDSLLCRIEDASTRPLRQRFLDRCGISEAGGQEFEDCLVDHFAAASVHDRAQIDAATRESDRSRRRSARLVNADLKDEGRNGASSRQTADPLSEALLPQTLAAIVHQTLKKMGYGRLTLCLLCTIIAGLSIQAAVECLQVAFDSAIKQLDSGSVICLGLFAIAFSLFGAIFWFVRSLVSHKAASILSADFQDDLIERTFGLPLSQLRHQRSANLARDLAFAGDVSGSFARSLTACISCTTLSLVFLRRLFIDSWLLAVVVSCLTLMASVLTHLLERQRTAVMAQTHGLSRAMDSSLYGYLEGIEKVRTTGIENQVVLEYTQRHVRRDQVTARQEQLLRTEEIAVWALAAIAQFAACILFPYSPRTGAGSFVLRGLLASSCIAATTRASRAAANCKRQALHLMTFRDRLDADQEAEAGGQMVDRLQGVIDLNQVSFRYDSKGPLVLNDLSLHVEPGECVGIVGASGSGKSTLLKLIMGFERPSSGTVRFDGQDLNELNLPSLRRKLGVVLQQNSLMSGSIYDNVRLSAPGVRLKDVRHACEQAGLGPDLDRMPMGLNTLVGQGGSSLSGGQRQRVLLARALVRKPNVLLLDEATSALDNESQAAVLCTLAELPCTKIVVAHRPEALRICNRILRLEDGRLSEQ